MLHNLRKITHAKMRRFLDYSSCRSLKPADELHYSGFSCTVLANESDTVVLAYMETDMIQKGPASIGHGQIIN